MLVYERFGLILLELIYVILAKITGLENGPDDPVEIVEIV